MSLGKAHPPLRRVDVAVSHMGKGAHSVHLMRRMPAGEVLRLRGAISREHPRKVTPALLLRGP